MLSIAMHGQVCMCCCMFLEMRAAFIPHLPSPYNKAAACLRTEETTLLGTASGEAHGQSSFAASALPAHVLSDQITQPVPCLHHVTWQPDCQEAIACNLVAAQCVLAAGGVGSTGSTECCRPNTPTGVDLFFFFSICFGNVAVLLGKRTMIVCFCAI